MVDEVGNVEAFHEFPVVFRLNDVQPKDDAVNDVFGVEKFSLPHDSPFSPCAQNDRMVCGGKFPSQVNDGVFKAKAVFYKLDAVEGFDGSFEECKVVCLSDECGVVPAQLDGFAVEGFVGEVADPPAGVFGGNVCVDGRYLTGAFVGVEAPSCLVVKKQPQEGLYSHSKGSDAVVGLLLLCPEHEVLPVFLFDGHWYWFHARVQEFSNFKAFQL